MLCKLHLSLLVWTLIFIVIHSISLYADNNKPVNAPDPNTDAKNATLSGIIDDTTPGWIYNGMSSFEQPELKNGSAHAGGPGTYAAFTFNGTDVELYGITGSAIKVDEHIRRLGMVKVSIDGKPVAGANLHSKDINFNYNFATICKLPKGNHVLQIEPESGWIVIDYIKVSSSDDSLKVNDVQKSEQKTNGQQKSNQPSGSKNQTDLFVNTSVIPDGDYYLISQVADEKYLESVNAGTDNNTHLDMSSFDQSHMQTWHVTRLNNGCYRITSAVNPNAAITFTPSTNGNMQPTLWYFQGYRSQLLSIVLKKFSYYAIEMPNDAKETCLDATSSAWQDGAIVACKPYADEKSQVWKFVPVQSGVQ